MFNRSNIINSISTRYLFVVFAFLSCGCWVPLAGQDKNSNQTATGRTNNEVPPAKQVSEFADLTIPPLGSLIEAAIAHSPLLDEQTAMITMRDWEVQTAKDEWGKYLLFFTEVRYGSIDILVSNGGSISYGDKSNSTRYNVGARFQLSIFDVLDLKQKKGAAFAQKAFEEAKRKELQRMITDDVIRLWNKLITYKEIVAINEEHVGVQNGNLFYAEQQYRAGDIPLLEYARIKEISIKADQEYQLAKKEFRETYLLLESLAGVKFSELKANRG